MTLSSPAASERRYTQAERIATDIAGRITSGQLKEGERLASELALAEHYDTSRGTIRRALTLLKNSDLVRTRPGSGSYVAFHGSSLAGSQGWTAATAQVGMPTNVEILGTDLIPTPDDLVELTTEPECWRIIRRRLLDNTPISVEISLIPANERVNTVMDYGLLGGSISATLRATGMVTTQGDQDVSVRPVPQSYAEALDVATGTPFLLTQRTGRSDRGELTESVTSWLSPEHFTLHLTFEE